MPYLRTTAYIETLSAMIRCETVSVPGQTDRTKFRQFQSLLRSLFPQVFSACTYEDFDGAFLLRWKGRKESALPVMFMNHQDVVEAAGPWKYPPFSAALAEDKLWGRGTLDTKGGLWAMLQAAEELIASGFVPAQDVYFEASCDEETDSLTADRISQELQRRGVRFRLVMDEGGMIVEEPMAGAKGVFAMIGVAEKNYMDLRFTARSAGGHASTPGKNTPLVRLGRFMAEAEDKNIFDAKLSPTTVEMLRRLAPSMDGPLAKVLADAKTFSHVLEKVMPGVSPTAGAMIRTTLAFTMASGSEARNVLPQEAYVVGNMRCSHHQGSEGSLAAIRKLADKYDIETTVLEPGFESPVTDFDTDEFRLVEKAVRTVFPGVTPAPYVMTGATDARFMSRICDNCIRFLPFR